MKLQLFATLATVCIFIAQCPAQAQEATSIGPLTVSEKNSINSATDVHNLSAADMLWLLAHPQFVKIEEPSKDEQRRRKRDSFAQNGFKICNGELDARNSEVGYDSCMEAVNFYRAVGPDDNPKRFEALIRYCYWASTQNDTIDPCGSLARELFKVGNIGAGKAVQQYAPGCHARHHGVPTNPCFGDALFLTDKLSPGEIVSIAQSACEKDLLSSACNYVREHGGQVQVEQAAIDQMSQARSQASETAKAELARHNKEEEERIAEHQREFHDRMSSLNQLNDQVSQGGTAILKAGNQQAAAIRAVGDANTAVQPAGVKPGAAPATNSASGLPAGAKTDPANGLSIAGTCERMDRFVKYTSTMNADDALLMSIQNTSSSDLYVLVKKKRSTWPAYSDTLSGSPSWGPLHPGNSGEVDVCFLIGGKHDKYAHDGDCSRPDDIVVVAIKATDLHTIPPAGYERACDAELNNIKWPQ